MTSAKREQAARILGTTAVTRVTTPVKSRFRNVFAERAALWAAVNTAKKQLIDALAAKGNGDQLAMELNVRAALATLGNLGGE